MFPPSTTVLFCMPDLYPRNESNDMEERRLKSSSMRIALFNTMMNAKKMGISFYSNLQMSMTCSIIVDETSSNSHKAVKRTEASHNLRREIYDLICRARS
jgi:hypothetical protein